MTFSSFSQKDTTIRIKQNDSLITIPKSVAIKIIKDLDRKDYLEEKVILLQEDTTTLHQMVATYQANELINSKKEIAYKGAIDNYKQISTNYNQYIIKQDKKLKWSKFKTTFSQVALLSLGIFTISKL